MAEYVVKVSDSDRPSYRYPNSKNNYLLDYVCIAREVDYDYWRYFYDLESKVYAEEFIKYCSGLVLIYSEGDHSKDEEDKVIGFVQLKGILPGTLAAIKNDMFYEYGLEPDDLHPKIDDERSIGVSLEVLYLKEEYRKKGIFRRALKAAFELVEQSENDLLMGVAITVEGNCLLKNLGLSAYSYSTREYDENSYIVNKKAICQGEKIPIINHRTLYVGSLEDAKKIVGDFITKNV